MGPKGKLWFDDDPNHNLEDRIEGACKAYRRAFGEEPNVVHINIHEAFEYTGLEPGAPCSPGCQGHITVVYSRSCLPNHYFVFREEDERQEADECEAQEAG